MRNMLWLWILLIGFACAGPESPEYASLPDWGNYSVEVPENWKELDFSEGTLLTRDGPFSQYILVQQRPVDKPFGTTGRILTRGMNPLDAAEVLLHEMEADPGVKDFRLSEYMPVSLDGRKGFRMVYQYRTRAGIPFRTRYYGLLWGDWFYNLRYNADETKYRPEDLETFLQLVSSFRITR